MILNHINPPGLHKNPVFTQIIEVTGHQRTIYIGGQNAVDADGNIVGKGDIAAQAEQVAQNLGTALAAAGATISDVVKWTVYLVHGQPAPAAFDAFQRKFGLRDSPPTISFLSVSGLANPDFLLEVDAIAVREAD